MSAFVLALFAVATTLATSTPARCATPIEDPVDDPCLEALTTMEMHACAQREQVRAERRLASLWRALVRRLPRREREAARSKETRSAKARDARCRAEASHHEGGSLLPLVYSSCLREAADARAAELRRELATARR